VKTAFHRKRQIEALEKGLAVVARNPQSGWLKTRSVQKVCSADAKPLAKNTGLCVLTRLDLVLLRLSLQRRMAAGLSLPGVTACRFLGRTLIRVRLSTFLFTSVFVDLIFDILHYNIIVVYSFKKIATGTNT